MAQDDLVAALVAAQLTDVVGWQAAVVIVELIDIVQTFGNEESKIKNSVIVLLFFLNLKLL